MIKISGYPKRLKTVSSSTLAIMPAFCFPMPKASSYLVKVSVTTSMFVLSVLVFEYGPIKSTLIVCLGAVSIWGATAPAVVGHWPSPRFGNIARDILRPRRYPGSVVAEPDGPNRLIAPRVAGLVVELVQHGWTQGFRHMELSPSISGGFSPPSTTKLSVRIPASGSAGSWSRVIMCRVGTSSC